MDKNQAVSATRQGAIAGCISGVMTALVMLYAIYQDASDDLAFFNDPMLIFDIVIIFLMAFGIYKNSRVAASLMLVYFVASKIIIFLDSGKINGIALGLIFCYFYARATQGAFVYHRLERQENPDRKRTSKWAYFVGGPVLLLFMIIIAYAVLSMTGHVPSTRVLEAHEISDKDRESLIQNGIIHESEEIAHFYSHGLTSIMDGGTLLTQFRVILYYPEEDQTMGIYELLYPDVKSIEVVEQGSAFTESVYQIDSIHPDAWIRISLSTEQKGDTKFIKALRAKTATFSENIN